MNMGEGKRTGAQKEIKIKDSRPKADKLTMTVYDIVPMFEGVSDIRLSEKLHNILNLTNSLEERLMYLSDVEANKDGDFIPSFRHNGGVLFCPFLRMSAGQESVVLLEHLQKKTVEINELVKEADAKTAGTLGSASFFCISGDLLVLTRAHTHRNALEVYINWLLREHNFESSQIRFVHKKNTANAISLREINEIKIGDSFITTGNSNPTEIIKFDGFKEKLLRLLLREGKSMEEHALEDVLSATITLKIRRKNIEKKSAILDTVLNIVNSDDVVITSKNGKKIKGTEYMIKPLVSIEKNDQGLYNDKQIETEMRSILKAVKNGKLVY